jgi:hypothetical protein
MLTTGLSVKVEAAISSGYIFMVETSNWKPDTFAHLSPDFRNADGSFPLTDPFLT